MMLFSLSGELISGSSWVQAPTSLYGMPRAALSWGTQDESGQARLAWRIVGDADEAIVGYRHFPGPAFPVLGVVREWVTRAAGLAWRVDWSRAAWTGGRRRLSLWGTLRNMPSAPIASPSDVDVDALFAALVAAQAPPTVDDDGFETLVAFAEQILDEIIDAAWKELARQAWETARNGVAAFVYRGSYGQWDAYWLGFYDFYRAIGTDGLDHLEGLNQVARASGWWWPLARIVVHTERPRLLHLDENGRLHHAEGPALEFRDGWPVFAWRGERVPRWVIEDPSPANIEREPNVETRRRAIENRTWVRYLEDIGAVPIDTADDPGNPGQVLRLYQITTEVWGEPTNLLVCTNGTVERGGVRRVFGLPVPRNITTALEAAAWTYSVPVAVYATLGRRT